MLVGIEGVGDASAGSSVDILDVSDACLLWPFLLCLAHPKHFSAGGFKPWVYDGGLQPIHGQ